MDTLEIAAVVRVKNQLTIPHQVAERHNIVPGQQLLIVDGASEDEFTVRVIRGSYAGALAGVFGTTEENVTYVRGERESWD
jgi:bifunctional DNA-binding transcriptional regulator/antitoxin component of YhaV-PrlF toxin-antitoxin module